MTLHNLLQVPLGKRAGQQRITPDVQIGCISCASGDGRFGGPVWCGSQTRTSTADLLYSMWMCGQLAFRPDDLPHCTPAWSHKTSLCTTNNIYH
jgi:hypothetical protein